MRSPLLGKSCYSTKLQERVHSQAKLIISLRKYQTYLILNIYRVNERKANKLVQNLETLSKASSNLSNGLKK